MFASAFALLYVGHLLADYPGQTDHQAAHKADRTAAGWRANLTHAATHVLLCALTLAAGAALLDDMPLTVARTAVALAWVGVTHSVIDRRWIVRRWMETTGQREFLAHGGAAHVDQAAHIGALAIAALYLAA